MMMEILGEDFPIVEQGGKSSSVTRRCPDTSKLKELTGFTAQVSLKEGLSKTLKWYLDNY
jgi:nucleoside-diphosphate-sugar epimerase